MWLLKFPLLESILSQENFISIIFKTARKIKLFTTYLYVSPLKSLLFYLLSHTYLYTNCSHVCKI
jgi:hypothetical protein